VELEFVMVEFMFSSWRGVHPPIKMDCVQDKGVAGRAFCKLLKGMGIDDGKWRERARVE